MAKHTPHVRIEVDNITSAPHVWIDGVPTHGLVDVLMHWHTKDPHLHANSITIQHYKGQSLSCFGADVHSPIPGDRDA